MVVAEIAAAAAGSFICGQSGRKEHAWLRLAEMSSSGVPSRMAAKDTWDDVDRQRGRY